MKSSKNLVVSFFIVIFVLTKQNNNMTTYYKSDLANIIEICQDYIDQSNKQEQEAYQRDLNDVCGDFSKLVESGIFHDAIGKVVNTYRDNNGNLLTIEVATEY